MWRLFTASTVMSMCNNPGYCLIVGLWTVAFDVQEIQPKGLLH
ncbi:MAG TPA: hypothetical protein ENI27_09835 [bacterium]|nr:hypothetical protein [bacterium]